MGKLYFSTRLKINKKFANEMRNKPSEDCLMNTNLFHATDARTFCKKNLFVHFRFLYCASDFAIVHRALKVIALSCTWGEFWFTDILIYSFFFVSPGGTDSALAPVTSERSRSCLASPGLTASCLDWMRSWGSRNSLRWLSIPESGMWSLGSGCTWTISCQPEIMLSG